MKNTGRRWTLQHRIALYTSIIVVLIVLLTSALTFLTINRTVEHQLGNRALHIATYVADLPEIREAFRLERPWEVIQPRVEQIRAITDAEFIVVGNHQGVRYSHPLEERIGLEMVGGDNEGALVHGRSYTSKAQGSLGYSLRGKTPIFDDQNNIIGIVSVGFLLTEIDELESVYREGIMLVAAIGLVVGLVGAVLLARSIKKLLFGLEPEEISSLYEVRDAVIQSIREGIMVINKEGHIVLLNQTAFDILSLPAGTDPIGQPVAELVPNTNLLEVLRTGVQQLDREMELSGKTIIANRLPVIAGGEVIGVVASFRLKSDIERLSEELSQVKRYSEALRSQTHEFSNLLYTISGLIQLGAYDEALELIHKESVDKQELIRWITNRVKAPWLGGILLGFANRARELKIELELDRNSMLSGLPAHVESSHVVSLLGNLMTNAFEAVVKLPEKERRVRLFVTDIGDDILIEVEDSGPGIAEEELNRIFELGYSTKESSEESRGYGLARVAELVRHLGGAVTVERGDLGGALFIVALPRERSRT